MKLQIENYKDKHEYISENGIRSVVYLMDCVEGLKQIPDKYFELAIVDPPYGIGIALGAGETRGCGKKKKDLYIPKYWDNKKPKPEYWSELFKTSKNQIVWGGNYFTSFLYESRGWLYWRKLMGGNYSDGELAWTSFDMVLKEFTMRSEQGNGRFHPTQKPVKLYEWLIKNYAKESDKILDTHLGSGSSRIAAHKANLPFMGFELDEDYFKASVKRFEQYVSQTRLF